MTNFKIVKLGLVGSATLMILACNSTSNVERQNQLLDALKTTPEYVFNYECKDLEGCSIIIDEPKINSNSNGLTLQINEKSGEQFDKKTSSGKKELTVEISFSEETFSYKNNDWTIKQNDCSLELFLPHVSIKGPQSTNTIKHETDEIHHLQLVFYSIHKYSENRKGCDFKENNNKQFWRVEYKIKANHSHEQSTKRDKSHNRTHGGGSAKR